MGKADVRSDQDVGKLLKEAGSLVKGLRASCCRTGGCLKPDSPRERRGSAVKAAAARAKVKANKPTVEEALA